MRKRILILYILLFTIAVNGLHAQGYPPPVYKWQVGEELSYTVRWSFLHLGRLVLQVLNADTLSGRPVYHCRIHIDSNPSLPFINLHDIYDSFIDSAGFYSHIFISYEGKGDHLIYTRYDFDYEKNSVHMQIENRKGNHSIVELDSTGAIHKKVQDSLSLLYFARAMAHNKAKLTVPVFAYNKLDSTHINFRDKLSKIKTNDHKIKTLFLDGRLKFVGIAGVKQDFKGWFSTDEQAVPLKANMKAFVGNVTLELDEWKYWGGDSVFVDLKDKVDK
jgi:hypothetical protein